MEIALQNQPSLLGVGYVGLRFGDTKARAQEILGPPNRRETIAYDARGSDHGEAWDYDHFEVTPWFDLSDESRLGTFETESPNLVVNREKIIGAKQSKVEAILR